MDIQSLKPSTSIRIFTIIGISIILGLLFDYLFYEKIPGISFPIYIIFVIVGLFAIATSFKKHISIEVVWLLAPLMFFSMMVAVRSSVLLTFLNIGGSILLLLLIAELLNETIRKFLFSDYIKIIFLPFKFIRPFFGSLSRVCIFKKVGTDGKIFSQVFKGILITIPVLLIFIILFASADLIINKYITNIIDTSVKMETIFRSILVLTVTSVFIGAYSYIFNDTKNIVKEKEESELKVGRIESSILLGSVNVLFFIFILVQLTYLFGGEGNISAQGFTYAEYARKGFFELVAVAIISFLLLFTTEKYIVRKNTGHTLMFIILSSTLILQIILIMVSAFTRMSLYEQAFGFTTLRLYTHVFIIFLAVVFALLLYKIHVDKRENAFAFHIFISIVMFLTVMNFINPDMFIARKNIERFNTTGELDILYLSYLSDDAIPETIKILDISEQDLGKKFASELYWHTQYKAGFTSKWQSSNMSRTKAETILNLKMYELEKYKNYESMEF